MNKLKFFTTTSILALSLASFNGAYASADVHDSSSSSDEESASAPRTRPLISSSDLAALPTPIIAKGTVVTGS